MTKDELFEDIIDSLQSVRAENRRMIEAESVRMRLRKIVEQTQSDAWAEAEKEYLEIVGE